MTRNPTEPSQGQARPASAPLAREARLKAALKANMARRKAQARARAADPSDTEDGAQDDAERVRQDNGANGTAKEQ